MKVITAYNNFARGKIDHDMQGRFDLPLYVSGLDVCKNFITNFKGGAKYRCGFEALIPFQDCALLEFKFSNNQNYILVMYANKMRFLSYDINGNFGWVLDGGSNILEIDTPWTLAESKQIARRKTFAQNSDVMYIVHENHEPRKLIRTAANAFTLRTFARKDDPFSTTFASNQTITGISQTTQATVTISSHGLTQGQRIRITGVVGMTQINNWTAAIVSVTDSNNIVIDINTTSFTAYSSGGTANRITAGSYPYTTSFYKGRLYYASTPTKFRTVWGSEAANFDIFTIPSVVTDDSAIQITLSEINERIESLFAGDNSLIAIAADGVVAINGGGVNEPIKADTVEANITSADGGSAVVPIFKDGFVFYAGRSKRNLYFFNYDLLTESFVALDSNIFSYDITNGLIQKLRYIKNMDNILWAHTENKKLLSLNFYEKENILGWHEHESIGNIEDIASITDNLGNPELFALNQYDGVFYIERLAEYVEFAQRSQFFTNNEQADNIAYNRFVAEQLKKCRYLDNCSVFSDLRTATITYDPANNTITSSTASFVSGDVGKHIAYKTLTGYEWGRFEITNYINDSEVEVEVLQTPTVNVYSNWYLSFNTVNGLNRFNGKKISIVADGGYLDDFTVSGGSVTFGKQITHVVAGYSYFGVMKSFSLGFQIQAENTQRTMKAITQTGIRTNLSLGGKFGSSLYRMQPVQENTAQDLNYIPPLPIDGTKYVNYIDTNERDKYFYIVQDEPLPFHVTCAIIDANYTVAR